MTENKQEVIVNLTGEAPEPEFEKVLIKEGEHLGNFSRIELIEVPKYTGSGTLISPP